MPDVSQEDLEGLRKKNESLRDQLANAQATQAEHDAQRQLEYEASQLVLENTRLEAQVASAKEAAKVANSTAGVANIAESTAEQYAAAQAALENPQGVPVDVNHPDNIKAGEKLVAAAVKASEKGGVVDTGSVPASIASIPADAPQVADKQNGGNS